MADSAIYVVQIRRGKVGVSVLARAATSASTEEFTTAEALWRFLVGATELRSDAYPATSERQKTPC